VYIMKNTHPFLVTQLRVDSVRFALLGERCFSRTYWANIESNATENWVNSWVSMQVEVCLFYVLVSWVFDSETAPGTGFRVKTGEICAGSRLGGEPPSINQHQHDTTTSVFASRLFSRPFSRSPPERKSGFWCRLLDAVHRQHLVLSMMQSFPP
jgi:hypothetical protein